MSESDEIVLTIPLNEDEALTLLAGIKIFAENAHLSPADKAVFTKVKSEIERVQTKFRELN